MPTWKCSRFVRAISGKRFLLRGPAYWAGVAARELSFCRSACRTNSSTCGAPRGWTRQRWRHFQAGRRQSLNPRKSLFQKHFWLACLPHQSECGVGRQLMTHYPYILSRNSLHYSHILFNKTTDQLRRIGARGGKISGRNHRARRALMLKSRPPVTPVTRPCESTVAAIAMLDAQFPWLRNAEKRLRKLSE